MATATLTLPVIDIEGHRAGDPSATARAADAVGHALRTDGFLSVVGHGIDWAQVEEIYGWAAKYHALDDAVKLDHQMGPDNMGYIPMGGAQQGDLPSLNAAFFMGRPGSKRNRFPSPGVLDGFQPAISAYYEAMDSLGHQLLPLYALAAGMPAGYFDQYFNPALATLRISHYPAVPAAENQWGIDPHSDAGFMTMLPTNPVAGLEICRPDGHWLPVSQEPFSFVVNAGDMLRRWSNDVFLSTRHRARNDTATDRFAIPFFFDPRVDTVIEVLPSCVTADNPARHESLVYRDYLTAFMRRGYAATRPGE